MRKAFQTELSLNCMFFYKHPNRAKAGRLIIEGQEKAKLPFSQMRTAGTQQEHRVGRSTGNAHMDESSTQIKQCADGTWGRRTLGWNRQCTNYTRKTSTDGACARCKQRIKIT